MVCIGFQWVCVPWWAVLLSDFSSDLISMYSVRSSSSSIQNKSNKSNQSMTFLETLQGFQRHSESHFLWDTVWRNVTLSLHIRPTVLAKIWRLVGCSKSVFYRLTVGIIAFRICMTCYRQKLIVWPGKSILSKKNPESTKNHRQLFR